MNGYSTGCPCANHHENLINAFLLHGTHDRCTFFGCCAAGGGLSGILFRRVTQPTNHRRRGQRDGTGIYFDPSDATRHYVGIASHDRTLMRLATSLHKLYLSAGCIPRTDNAAGIEGDPSIPGSNHATASMSVSEDISATDTKPFGTELGVVESKRDGRRGRRQIDQLLPLSHALPPRHA